MAATAPPAVELGDGDTTVACPARLVVRQRSALDSGHRVGTLHGEVRQLLIDGCLGRRQVGGGPLGTGGELDLGAMRRGEVVDDLGLLLEAGQLGIVELVTAAPRACRARGSRRPPRVAR